eukprot:753618-Hanusia_phi.AAC.3
MPSRRLRPRTRCRAGQQEGDDEREGSGRRDGGGNAGGGGRGQREAEGGTEGKASARRRSHDLYCRLTTRRAPWRFTRMAALVLSLTSLPTTTTGNRIEEQDAADLFVTSRAAADVRTIVNKKNLKLAEPGSVAFNFDHVGQVPSLLAPHLPLLPRPPSLCSTHESVKVTVETNADEDT